MTIQMKATEQYLPVVLFIMLYKVVLTFKSVGEILKCDLIQMKAIKQCLPMVLLRCNELVIGSRHFKV